MLRHLFLCTLTLLLRKFFLEKRVATAGSATMRAMLDGKRILNGICLSSFCIIVYFCFQIIINYVTGKVCLALD